MILEVSSRSLLTSLGVEHSEWQPLLAVIEATLREAKRPEWARWVPRPGHAGPAGRPLLDGAVITIAPRFVGRWVRHVFAVAAGAGTDVEPLTTAFARGVADPLLFFEAVVSHDLNRLDELARAHRDATGALRGLAPLIARPLLQACRRAWADRLPARWRCGHCPICGSWPALAEIRRLDGSRHLRCGPCGADWQIEPLRCPFCGEDDGERLGSLASPDSLERQSIEVCDSCRGYLKTMATLNALHPDHVMLKDLATLSLDMAALERDYRRPAAKARGVVVGVVAEPSRLRNLLGLWS